MRSLESKLNFVIADDDQDDQSLLLQAFTDNAINFESTSVYSGSQLLDYLLNRKAYNGIYHSVPDFILLDLNMPVKNGFEVLRELKATVGLQSIPIYVLTTSSAPNDQTTAMRLGASKFYTKANNFSDIKKMVKDIVELS